MYRSVFASIAGAALVASTLLTPSIALAKRCPVEPPSTLLALYKRSDAIYIGKFDKTTEGNVTKEDEDYKVIDLIEHYSISTTLKGEPRKFFERHRDDYQSKQVYENTSDEEDVADAETIADEGMIPVEEGPEEELVEDEEIEDAYRPIEEGDSVILFLRESEERDDADKPIFDVVHYRDGVKRMPESSIASYEARIKDLNRIFSSKEPDDAAIVAWLIKCIEDPIARWEGAQVLLDGLQEIEYREERAKEIAIAREEALKTHSDAMVQNVSANANAQASVDASDQSAVVEEDSEGDEDFPTSEDATYAQLLTQAQKDGLVRLAIKNTPKKTLAKGQTVSMSRGDDVLFELAKRWGDYKLAAAMLEWLAVAGDNYSKSDLMNSIAEILKDKELKSIGEKFSDATYQDDSEAVEGDDAEEADTDAAAKIPATDAPAEAEAVKTEQAKAEVVNIVKAEATQLTETSEPAADVPKQTYGQLRGELLANFTNRANVVLANEKKAAKEKAKLKSRQASATK